MARFAAVIFDMDGVLVDGEPLHFAAINRLLETEGQAISLDQYRPYMGTKAGWTDMVRDMGLSRPAGDYASQYEALILDEYRRGSVPTPGATRLVRGLREAHMPLGLASSSKRSWVETCLAGLALADAFDAVITGSDVEEGKPSPAIYIEAAQRLGANAEDCLAIEDAPAGIESALRAGMTCWAVRTEYTRGLALRGAAREVQSLEEISLSEIVEVPA